MIANYHTHTSRCNHASGTEEEYVRNAIDRDLKIFGFSDHTPQFFPGDYYSFMRMYPNQLDDYCQTVRNLRTKYAHQIHMPLGLEAEYYPGIWKNLLPRLQDAGIEYLILGQHWLGNEQGEHGSGGATADEALLKRYCHQVMEALDTGKFTYLAHPDLFRFVGDRTVYRRHMGNLCRFARQADIPLEINLLGIHYNKHYPNPDFFALAAEEGCKVILGIDAHDPSHIRNPEPEEKALEIVRHFGLKLLDTVELRPL
jgi:histidinol-phosphatase (PHP family)